MRQNAPGCFGLPTAVSANSSSCNLCPSRPDCLYEARCFLETLPDNPLTQRERLALAVTCSAFASSPPKEGGAVNTPRVVASSRGFKRMVLSAAQLDSVAQLPIKVATQVRQLLQRGWFDFARCEMKLGRNPAGKGWRKVFCDLLLAGGARRAGLELALVEQLDLSPAAARVQASVGVSVFVAGHIASERFGQFTLGPNQAFDNQL